MLEKKNTARSAKTTPKDKAKAASKTKKPAGARTPASKPATIRARKRDMHESIQRRAYELWEGEGRPAGREHHHWLQAEREIAQRAASMSA